MPNPILTALMLSCAMAGFTPALTAAGAPEGWVQPESWTEPSAPVAVADNFYYVGSQELAAYLLTSPEGHILIDAPLEANVDQIVANIRALGYDPADIEVILLTHGHFDHAGGVARMVDITGAQLALSARAAELVAAGGRGDFFLGDDAAYPGVAAGRILADGELIELGEWTLRAELTPGHTRGCTSFSGEAEIAGAPYRWVLSCSLSVLAGYRLVDDPSYPGIGDDFCASLARLDSLRADIFLVNHASFFDFENKRKRREAGQLTAFVDQDGYRAYLRTARNRVESVLREQGRAGGCASPQP